MIRAFVRLLLRLVYRVRVSGAAPPPGRMLIVANHQSFLDGVLLWAFLPVDAWFLTHTQVVQSLFFRICLRFVNHLVVDTSSPFALKLVVGLLEQNKPVVIFPEGRVTVTGSLMKIYDGPAFVAARTNSPVFPLWIDGAVHARGFSRMTGDFPLRWRPRVSLTMHPLESLDVPPDVSRRARRRIAGEQLRRLMLRLRTTARPNTHIYDQFLHAVALHGRSRDLIEDTTGKTFTYGLLLKGSLALGRLVSRLAPEGDCVGVLLPNVGATVALILGLLGSRRIPAMLNYTAGADGMQSAIRAAKVRVVITSRAFLEKARLGPTIARLQGVQIVHLEDLRETLTLFDKLWLIGWALWFPRTVLPRIANDEPAVVIFTSGSEGKPKGVVLSHASITANLAQIHALIEVSPKDKFLSAMPLFHSFGFTGGFLLPVLRGSRIYIYPSPLHYRLIPEMAYDRDCTVLFATNTFLSHYARRAHPFDFRSVRYVVSGAEKLTDEVRQTYAEKFGVRILEGYGATECSPLISANVPTNPRTGTLGQIAPCMDHRLEPVPGIDGGGILHVRGPNLMLGYWKEDSPREYSWPHSVFGPGWYNTGDVVSLDEDGFLRILGRVRRFAKVAGEMVSLEVVEKIAESASPKHLHASTARPDAGRGEMILLFTQDRDLRREHLQQAARSIGAPDLAVPRKVILVDAIPLLGNGKKDYPAIARMAEAIAKSEAVSQA